MHVLVPYFHFIGIMTLMGSLIAQHLFMKPVLIKQNIKTIATIDLIYGIAALVVLSTGLLRWFVYGKGSDYYLSNPLFHIKITLFVIIVIISVFPTLRILKWRRQSKASESFEVSEKMAKRTLMFIRVELLLVAIIPILAVMVDRGH